MLNPLAMAREQRLYSHQADLIHRAPEQVGNYELRPYPRERQRTGHHVEWSACG